VSNWNEDHVFEWFKSIPVLSQYANAAKEGGINGVSLLSYTTNDELVKELNFTQLHCRRFFAEFKQMKK